MVFFPNEQIDLYDYTTLETLDSYGNPKIGYVYITTVPVDFQPMTAKDSMQEYGEILEDTFKMYCEIDLNVTNTMVVRLVSDGSVYNITGTPQVNNHFIKTNHKKILLQKLRKPVQLPPKPEPDEVEP